MSSNKEKKIYLQKKRQQQKEKQNVVVNQQVIKEQRAQAALRLKFTEERAIRELPERSYCHAPGFHYLSRLNPFSSRNSYNFNKEKYIDFLLLLSKKKSKLLNCSFIENYHPFVNILQREEQWIRSLEEWVPESKSVDKQFSSLLRHLFCKYKDVPIFMDKAWLCATPIKLASKPIDWFISLGLGNNIRKCEELPYPLSKKEAYFFIKAPKDFEILEAFTYAIIRNLGGNERMCRKLKSTRIGTDFNSNKIEFYKSIYRYFINNPFLDPIHYGPIIDYVLHQKYTILAGQNTSMQPNLCMKNRDANTLLKEVENWHKKLGSLKDRSGKTWLSCGLHPYEKSVQNQDGSVSVYHIRELLSTGELVREGKELRHCVATYECSCLQQSSSIWSLFEIKNDSAKIKRLVTIQVSGKRIVQTRGFANAYPETYCVNIILSWAKLNGLSYAY